MSFTKKSTYVKDEYEYESVDGEKYTITFVRHGDRFYVQWNMIPPETKESTNESGGANKQTTDNISQTVIIDAKMLEVLYGAYLEISGAANKTQAQFAPNIIDHRAEQISSQVQKTMKNYDEQVQPFQSFNPNSFNNPVDVASMRSGVNIDNITPAQSTPEEWSVDQVNENDPQWKQDAARRKTMGKADYRSKGNTGLKFKRVGADELI